MISEDKYNLGKVFTSISTVSFILDEVDYKSSIDLSKKSILEPSAGSGAFAIEILKRLYDSSRLYDFDFVEAVNNNVTVVEISPNSYYVLLENIKSFLGSIDISYNSIEKSVFICSDFLLHPFSKQYDCIVGNPPYVRNERILPESKNKYKELFSTFKYRSDLYIAFYQKGLNLLSKEGKLSYVCSNRWLFNQYGAKLRELIVRDYNLLKIINVERAKLFEENVVAYPCITTIGIGGAKDIVKYYDSQSVHIELNSIKYLKSPHPISENWNCIFLNYDIDSNYLSGILEQGFEIGIGVATGADRVFIKKVDELNGIEKETLLPIIKSKCLRGNEIKWDRSYVINPFQDDGLRQLSSFPHLRDYLNSHKSVLQKRHVARKNPNSWYRTIDKIKPGLFHKNKLLLPDLSGCEYLFIDDGKYYPHHNVYYITHEDIERLKVLAAIIMSDFTKHQLSQIGIRMNGGLPRFQAQVLKKIRIPNIDEIGGSEYNALVEAYDNKNKIIINEIINNILSNFNL